MDLSKLPKLSKTSTPGNDSPAPIDYSSLPRRRYEEEEGPLNFLDIFLAMGMGLLFMFMGMSYGKHLLGSKEAFPEITSTGYVWTAPHPKAGQPITPEELTPENRKAYDAQLLGRRMDMISQSSVFLLGSGLLVAGLFGIVGHLAFLPLLVRRIGAIIGVIATVTAMAYAAWATAAMLSNGITPPLTMVAILVGGLSLFMQVASVRALSGPSLPAVRRDRSEFSQSPIAPQRQAAAATGDRRVHHRFAHDTLRRAVFQNPTTVIGVLQGPGGTRYLRDLWEATCHATSVDPAAAAPMGLEAEMTQVGPYSAAVVTMPTARAAGEAKYIGLVLRSYTREDGAVIERSPLVLYYTLEVADPVADTTVLCEWQAGDHVKFADVVMSNFGSFREAMWKRVQARQEGEDRLIVPA